MTLSLLLTTLLAWSAQVAVLVAVAAAVALTIASPKGRLLFWQGILLLAVLIPLIEPWRPVETPVATASIQVSTSLPGSSVSAAPAPKIRWQREDWLVILAIGAALRLLWIAAGFARLRGYRIQARLLDQLPLPFVADAARWYESDRVPGPVTYGWLRPSILLPARVLALPAVLREPIACHELLHVNRRDWLFVLGEEIVRCALWFHPAIWFLLQRIQLAREQVVDREVVRLTGNRDHYLDALVAVAEQSLHADLAPAPLFLRKRQLAVRVAQILKTDLVKETSMSRSRIVAHVTGAVTLALAAAGVAVWLFPFISPATSVAQTVADSPGVAVTAGAPLIHRSPVHTPAGVTAAGTVIVDATLNSKGEVTDAHVISGPSDLRRSAIESVLQWHYSPGPSQAQVSISFAGGESAAVSTMPVPLGLSGVRGGRGPQAPPPPPPPPPPGVATTRQLTNNPTGTLQSLQFSGIGPEAERELRSRIGVSEGSTISRTQLQTISQAITDFDSHLGMALTVRQDANGVDQWTLRIQPASATLAPLPPQPPATSSGVGPQKVGAGVMAAKLISRVDPQYTEQARQAKWQGTVVLSVIIDKTGVPKNITVARPLGMGLDENAIAAVEQWRFQPTKLNNEPVEVLTQIEVNFRLQ